MGLMGQWWTTPFFNYSGTLSVDTFFFISGFLASYLMLTKLDKVITTTTTTMMMTAARVGACILALH